MNYIDAIILGIVEGITEFLPVSSTGHLILTSHALGILETPFIKSFEIIIQLGAILAVVVLYWRLLLTNRHLIAKVIAAFVPTAVIGLTLYSLIKTYLLGNQLVVVIALAVGGLLLIAFEKRKKEADLPEAGGDVTSITYKQAFLVGLFQTVAMIPGVSRSAATIIGGELLGLSRKAIVEFSFLLAIPTMAAATGYDLLKTHASFSGEELSLLAVGFIVSFLVALLAIKSFLGYIKKHSFTAFGVYRLILAAVFALIFLI